MFFKKTFMIFWAFLVLLTSCLKVLQALMVQLILFTGINDYKISPRKEKNAFCATFYIWLWTSMLFDEILVINWYFSQFSQCSREIEINFRILARNEKCEKLTTPLTGQNNRPLSRRNNHLKKPTPSKPFGNMPEHLKNHPWQARITFKIGQKAKFEKWSVCDKIGFSICVQCFVAGNDWQIWKANSDRFFGGKSKPISWKLCHHDEIHQRIGDCDRRNEFKQRKSCAKLYSQVAIQI